MNLKRTTLVLAAMIIAAACNRGPRQYRPAVDPELLQLSKEQVFEKGEEQYGRKRWQKARTYYRYLYETNPNDPLGRRSLLRVADTYFEQGDPVNLVEAQYKYRDFINRYPTNEQTDYAMLRIAMCSFRQMEKPDRDQQKTTETLDKLNDMMRSYPSSPFRPEAVARRQEVLDRLAKHEHLVARFYLKRGNWNAAAQRLNYLVDTYPDYSDRAASFYDLGRALANLGRKGEARLYFERVISEFPKSAYAEQARRRLNDNKA